jgi:hypothetical protein
MAQGTYIGQAQINTQTEYEDYQVGDIVVWKSSNLSKRYFVEGFNGGRVILRELNEYTWSPQSSWFIKE